MNINQDCEDKMNKAKLQADKVLTVKSVDELPALGFKNLLLKIATANLKHNGFYSCQIESQKVFIELAAK